MCEKPRVKMGAHMSGASVSYSYSGGNKRVNCNSLVVPTLTTRHPCENDNGVLLVRCFEFGEPQSRLEMPKAHRPRRRFAGTEFIVTSPHELRNIPLPH